MKSHYILTAVAVTSLLNAGCNHETDYDATGIFETTTVTVSAETQGRILSMPAVEGDSVSAGEILCRVDSSQFGFQERQLGSQKSSAASNIPDISVQGATLRTQIAHQREECNRINRLLADGAATQKQKDDADAQLAVLQAQLNALVSTLNKNTNSITDNTKAITYQQDLVRDQMSKCIITSPITGTILEKYAEAGEYAVPGKPLMKLADLRNVYLRSYFTAEQLADLKLGQKVTVIADFGGGKTFEYPGTITWISEESEFTPKSIQTQDSRANLVYAVKISVKNDGRIKLGQYGEVRL